MKVLNLLTSGSAGGIESLCRDIGCNSQFENGFVFLFGGGTIYEQMKQMGLRTYSFQDKGKKISLKKLNELKKIAEEYDIIAAHHGDPFLKLYHWILSKMLKKKYVTFVHSCYEDEQFYPENKVKKYIAHKIFQEDMKCSDKIIFVSKAGKKSCMSAFDIAEDKAVVVYNGIGRDKIQQGKNNVISPKEPYRVTYIGRLERVKGVHLLLEAVNKLKNEYSSEVSIVGTGTEKENLKQLTQTLKIDHIVTFYGQQQDVIPFLKNTDIFVYPSVWQEVFGISLVEAMAFGIPCITNRVGGIPEIIEDGKSGFLCEAVTAEALMVQMRKVIHLIQSDDIKKISINAKIRAEQFSILHTVDGLRDVYQTLL